MSGRTGSGINFAALLPAAPTSSCRNPRRDFGCWAGNGQMASSGAKTPVRQPWTRPASTVDPTRRPLYPTQQGNRPHPSTAFLTSDDFAKCPGQRTHSSNSGSWYASETFAIRESTHSRESRYDKRGSFARDFFLSNRELEEHRDQGISGVRSSYRMASKCGREKWDSPFRRSRAGGSDYPSFFSTE